MHLCMYVCMYVCIYVCMYVGTDLWLDECLLELYWEAKNAVT